MPEFFKRLNYSFGNEDWRTEKKALQIKPNDTVLCITASGDRPLHLLLNDCKEIVSVDANPIQNYLLSLKCAALQKFDFETYLNFLEGKAKDPILLTSLLPLMEKEAASYWQDNRSIVKKGVLFQGKVECLFKVVSRLFKCLRPIKIKKLFQFNDIEAQKTFLDSEWDTTFMKKMFALALHPVFPKVFFNDPGLFAHVDPSINVGPYIYDRMLKCLHNCLANENPFVSLFFQGSLKREAYPPYLRPEESNYIKDRVGRIKVKTRNVIDYLKTVPDQTFDAFSLSDIASYMPQDVFNDLMHSVYRTAKPNARFCIRQFTSNHPIPTTLKPYFKRDLALEKQLESEDYFFVYRFMTGRITPTKTLDD